MVFILLKIKYLNCINISKWVVIKMEMINRDNAGKIFFAIAVVICLIYGFAPNVWLLIYVIFAGLCFIVALTRFTAAVTTVVPDFANLLGIVMQLFFWFTPIIWDLSMVSNNPILLKIMQCTPFTYIVTSFRQVFMNHDIVFAGNGIYTIVFWTITILLFIWGNSVFKRTKKDFADVL